MAAEVTPITIRGRYFWKGEERFLIKGVVYQQYDRSNESPSRSVPDPLADDQLEDLRLSIPLFKELGLNTIFVYSIDETKNHDAAMNLLASAGLYVLFSLSTPQRCIDRDAPFESYTADLVRRTLRAVDAAARYANTLGLVVANEVVNSLPSTRAAPVIRALARDVRRYMRLAATEDHDDDGGGGGGGGVGGQRVLPLGVSAADVQSVLLPQFAYLCGVGEGEGEGEDGALDFFSFNCYSWSGQSSMSMSGYDSHVKRFSRAPVPVFFSEYGANAVSPRPFGEAQALCSPAMTGVFSGGIVYEWFLGPNRYGLVKKGRRWVGQARDGNCESDDRKGEEWEEEVYLSRTQDYKNLRTNLRAAARKELVTIPQFAGGSSGSGSSDGDGDGDSDAASSSPSSLSALKRPGMPGPGTASWSVDRAVPECPLDWEEVRLQIADRQWVDVEREVGRLNIEDTSTIIT